MGRQKLLGVMAIFFVSLMLADRFLMTPFLRERASLEKAIDQENLKIKKSLHLLAQKQKILSQIREFHSLESSPEVSPASLFTEIESLAKKSLVSLMDMKPVEFKEAGVLKKYSLNLRLEGGMERLLEFMYSVETSKNQFLIEKYQMIPKAKGSEGVLCNMTVSRVVIP